MFSLIVRLLYLPFFLLGGNGLAIYVVQNGHSNIWLGVIVCACILLSFLLERAVPYDQAFNRPQGDALRDFYHFLVNEGANIIGVAAVPFLAGLIDGPTLWPEGLPLWLQLLIAILIADVGITLAHFASHRFEALWRLHAVHHSVKRMYGFNGLMKHPLHQFIETLAGTAPLLAMGIPQDVLSLFVVAALLQLLLQHSNVNYWTGPLKYLLAINVVHRFHHLKTAKEGDVNFGFFTTLTDRLLGTAYYDRDRVIGIDDLGIGDQPNYPVSYLAQLVAPFHRSRPLPTGVQDTHHQRGT